MVIFNSYVKLPEGNLAECIFCTAGIDDPRSLAEKHCMAKACVIVYAASDRTGKHRAPGLVVPQVSNIVLG